MRYFAFACAAVLCLGGCGTHLPNLVDPKILPLEDLVEDIDCEFQDAVREQIYDNGRTWLKTWQGQYTITLKGNETGSAKIASTATPILISSRTNLNIGAGGGTTTTANRTALLKFTLDFSKVKRDGVCVRLAPASGHPMLTGKIGFKEWMERALAGALSDPTLEAKTSSISSIGHTFEFSLDVTGNASPVFTIVSGPTTTLTPTGTIDRLEDNIVDVSLGKPAPATDSVSKTTAKYNAQQLKAMADLTKAIEDLASAIGAGNKKLADNKEFLAKVRELQPFNIPEATIKGQFAETAQPFALGKRREAVEFFSPENSAKAKELLDLEATVATQQRDLKTAQGQFVETVNHPAEQTTTRREVRATSPLSADQNPNVTNTQLQLTFERLNNNLRVTVP